MHRSSIDFSLCCGLDPHKVDATLRTQTKVYATSEPMHLDIGDLELSIKLDLHR
jgi:hypothetical protein